MDKQNDFSRCLLCQKVWNAQELAKEHFSLFTDYNKMMILDVAEVQNGEDLAACFTPTDSIRFTRWKNSPFPLDLNVSPLRVNHKSSEDVFSYPAYNQEKEMHWHLNFAHLHLFIAYGGRLFAQDEIQVLEHPILGSVREALVAEQKKMKLGSGSQRHLKDLTSQNGKPTPILIEGADRKLSVAMDPNPSEGRPRGLYGNQFSAAPFESVEKALIVFPIDKMASIRPRSNLIAIEALSGGYGTYKGKEIEYILETAFSGFLAAKIQTEEQRIRLGLEKLECVIHTGHWGTGAYGGNRVLMSSLQIVAAELAEVDQFHFHTHNMGGTITYQEGLALAKSFTEPMDLQSFVKKLEEKRFRWGVSDGN